MKAQGNIMETTQQKSFFFNNNSKKSSDKDKITFVTIEESQGSFQPFWVLTRFVNSVTLRRVTKKKWEEFSFPVITHKGNIIKYMGMTQAKATMFVKGLSPAHTPKYKIQRESKFQRRIEELDEDFEAQSLLENINNVTKGISNILEMLKNIGEKENLVRGVNKSVDTVDMIAGFDLNIITDFALFFCTSLALFKSFNVAGLLAMCLSAYKLFVASKKVINSQYQDAQEVVEEFQAQSVESLLFAAATMLMPSKLFEIFRRMSLLTSSKFFDDTSMFHSLISVFLEYFNLLIDYIPTGEGIKGTLKQFLRGLPFGKHHHNIGLMRKMNVQWQRDPSFIIQETVREQIKTLGAQLSESSILEWERRSAGIKAVVCDFRKLLNACKAYEEATRIEPSCFVFQGKPGVLKSFVVGMLVDVLGESRYVHTIKATEDGKDFWDMYNNESVVIMDDVGQQGISQWRTIINLVAPLKYPLDCAKAELKDTKYFNSSKLFLTTNNFTSLNGLTKSDCISDVRALWRRGYVFDFQVVKDADSTTLVGDFLFKYFDVGTNRFENAFPPALRKFLTIPAKFTVTRETERVDYLTWMLQIIKACDRMKIEQKDDSKLTPDEIRKVQERLTKVIRVPEIIVSECDDLEAQNGSEWLATNNLSIDDFMDGPLAMHLQIADEFFDSESEDDEEDEEPETIEIDEQEHSQSFKFYLQNLVEYIKGFLHAALEKTAYALKVFFTSPKVPMVLSAIMMFYYKLLVVIVVSVLASFIAQKIVNAVRGREDPDFSTQAKCKEYMKYAEKINEESVATNIRAVGKQVLPIRMHYEKDYVEVNGLISGHMIILPAHACQEDSGFCTVYKNAESNHRLYDHIKYERIYYNLAEDVAVIQLNKSMMTPFKNLSRHFVGVGMQNAWLVNNAGFVPVSDVRVNHILKSDALVYKISVNGYKEHHFAIKKELPIFYKIEEKGLCGTLVMDVDEGIQGMHVAGKAGVMGAAVCWSAKTRNELKNILEKDAHNILEVSISDKVIPDFSGVKLDLKLHTPVPSSSTIIPSPLFGVFPVYKTPADLQHTGFHTVKDIGKKSFAPVKQVDQAELEFGSKVLDLIIGDFTDLTEAEIIKGTDDLAGINKKSSNGYKCEKEKTSYFDFANGCYLPEFRTSLNSFENNLREGYIDFDKFVNVETLKDELRGIAKEGKPRSFRVSTVYTQVLTKKYTGQMVSNLIQARHMHQIMIGVNPYREWDDIYQRLSMCAGVWAGDVGTWDGAMLPQVQDAIIKILLNKYKGSHRAELSTLLYAIPYCVVSMQDDTYLTNHSMPSGNFLTAIFNSLVNRFYTAMWYHRNVAKASPFSFHNDIVDFVYGDDKLNGCVKKELSDKLNAVTMREFFESIGMTFTTASKQKVVKPFESLSEVSFLKRHFRYHPMLKRVMCPLEMETILSSPSWIDSRKDERVVMQDKLGAFQRELFLHQRVEELIAMEFKCLELGIPFNKLSNKYLVELFTSGLSEFDNFYGVF